MWTQSEIFGFVLRSSWVNFLHASHRFEGAHLGEFPVVLLFEVSFHLGESYIWMWEKKMGGSRASDATLCVVPFFM